MDPRRYTPPTIQDPKTAVVTSPPHGQATRRCPNLHSWGGEGAPGPAATNLELCLGEVRGWGVGGGGTRQTCTWGIGRGSTPSIFLAGPAARPWGPSVHVVPPNWGW